MSVSRLFKRSFSWHKLIFIEALILSIISGISVRWDRCPNLRFGKLKLGPICRFPPVIGVAIIGLAPSLIELAACSQLSTGGFPLSLSLGYGLIAIFFSGNLVDRAGFEASLFPNLPCLNAKHSNRCWEYWGLIDEGALVLIAKFL